MGRRFFKNSSADNTSTHTPSTDLASNSSDMIVETTVESLAFASLSIDLVAMTARLEEWFLVHRLINYKYALQTGKVEQRNGKAPIAPYVIHLSPFFVTSIALKLPRHEFP